MPDSNHGWLRVALAQVETVFADPAANTCGSSTSLPIGLMAPLTTP